MILALLEGVDRGGDELKADDKHLLVMPTFATRFDRTPKSLGLELDRNSVAYFAYQSAQTNRHISNEIAGEAAGATRLRDNASYSSRIPATAKPWARNPPGPAKRARSGSSKTRSWKTRSSSTS